MPYQQQKRQEEPNTKQTQDTNPDTVSVPALFRVILRGMENRISGYVVSGRKGKTFRADPGEVPYRFYAGGYVRIPDH